MSPLGAAAPAAGEDPQHPLPDAPGGQRRRLHQLPRQPHPGLYPGVSPERHRRIPYLRLPELDSRHGDSHRRGAPAGQLCEATLCYTGDILDPKRDKYTLKYYVDMAKELEKRGAHLLCIKDMSGLLKPYAAKKLVTALKTRVGLPIHLHTHDTSGNQVAAYLMAAEAGVDIVDCAIDSMSSTTSQPSPERGGHRPPGPGAGHRTRPEKLQTLSDYWADVRLRYSQFEAGIKNPSTDIYRYEMPGGQYTNLKSQVESLGLGPPIRGTSRRCMSRSTTCWATL